MPLFNPLANVTSTVPFGVFMESAATSTTMSTAQSGTGVAAVHGYGTSLTRGTTATDGAAIMGTGGQYTMPVYDKNPIFWVSFDDGEATAGQTYQLYMTMDTAGSVSDVLPQMGKYVGFKLKNNNGTLQIYSVHCDGTNAEVATLLAGVAFGLNTHTGVAAMTSGNRIDFYVDGMLLATHTVNLPAGPMHGANLYDAVGVGTVGTTSQLMGVIHGMGLTYDAY